MGLALDQRSVLKQSPAALGSQLEGMPELHPLLVAARVVQRKSALSKDFDPRPTLTVAKASSNRLSSLSRHSGLSLKSFASTTC